MTLPNLHILKRLCNWMLYKFSCKCHCCQSNNRIFRTGILFDSSYIAEQRCLWVLFPILARVLRGLVFLREDCTTVCRFYGRLCAAKQLTKSHIP